MNRRQILGSAALAAAASAAGRVGAAAPATIRAVRLRTEWLDAPVGLDTRRPRFTWEVDGPEGARGLRQGAYRLRVATSPARLRTGADLWDSGRVAGARGRAQPARPLPLETHSRYWWSVELWDGDGRPGTPTPPTSFATGVLDAAEWGGWIAARPDVAQAPHVRGSTRQTAAHTRLPLFRRAFPLAARPARALLSIAGLGQFELSVNGVPASRSLLDPAWSNYRKTVFYETYDVTDLLMPGANRLGVMLGNGMYDVQRQAGRYTKFVDRFGVPKLICRLTIDHPDGRREVIGSDRAWATRPGPILFSSIYGGEDVDGRLDVPGWDRPGGSDEGWAPVLAVEGPGGALRAQGVPPITVARTLAPVKVTRPAAGVIVYDFGENVSARPAMMVRGPAGAKVTLVPGEALGTDGRPDQRSYNAAPERAVTFSYILNGEGTERFRPRFSYQGFRYLEARLEGEAAILSAASEFIHADIPEAGTFRSGDTLFERIHDMIDRSVLSNMMSVLTDCPHREKLGWLEQTYLNAATVLMNRDAITLYEKLVGDIADAQQADGMVPGIAPEYVAFVDPDGSDAIYRNSPEWGMAAVLAPWAAYRAYGDPTVLDRGYPAMRRYLAYLETRAEGGLLDFGMGDWYDIGPKDPGPSQLTSRAVTATLLWYQGLVTGARIARVLGRPGPEAAGYEARAAAVGRAFLARFGHGDGRFDTGSQTAQAMPLALGLVPRTERAAALRHLVAAIRATGNGVTAGDVGFHYVVEALGDADRDDVLFDMMSVTDRPSYGYQLAHGATALAESWDANPTKSLNHFMLGHGEGWLYRRLAGVRVDFAAAAPERIVTLAPRPVRTVPSAGATYRSVLGEVACRWERRPGLLALDATVPAGATATVRVPTPRPDAVREGGGPAEHAAGVERATRVDGGLELVVGSGRYRFLTPA